MAKLISFNDCKTSSAIFVFSLSSLSSGTMTHTYRYTGRNAERSHVPHTIGLRMTQSSQWDSPN